MGVSRAEGKLAGFVREFGVDFRGLSVLDIGSSTGGWTEFALKSGANKVVAVEKGTRQMRGHLRDDLRVELHEKTDIFEFDTCAPDLVMADVSFVSLRKVLAHTKKNIAGPNTQYLVMCKPQFEARAEQLVDGVVKNEKMRREILRDFEMWLQKSGFVTKAKRDSEVRGKYGNLERLYWLDSARG